MNKRNWFAVALAPLMTIALLGCDVDVEDSGALPDVDVTATEGRMPDIDVNGPEVTTGTETIEVPTVDIDIPEENDE